MAAHQHFGAETVFKAEMPKANADMNITPMIDVLLVLLVICSERGTDRAQWQPHIRCECLAMACSVSPQRLSGRRPTPRAADHGSYLG